MTFSPHPDGELGFSEFKAMKRLDDQRRRYDEELVAAQPYVVNFLLRLASHRSACFISDRYDSEQLSLERRSMFAPKVLLRENGVFETVNHLSICVLKVPLGLPDADVYARYFRDRLRGLEGTLIFSRNRENIFYLFWGLTSSR